MAKLLSDAEKAETKSFNGSGSTHFLNDLSGFVSPGILFNISASHWCSQNAQSCWTWLLETGTRLSSRVLISRYSTDCILKFVSVCSPPVVGFVLPATNYYERFDRQCRQRCIPRLLMWVLRSRFNLLGVLCRIPENPHAKKSCPCKEGRESSRVLPLEVVLHSSHSQVESRVRSLFLNPIPALV